jgi:hypothetical protein
MTLQARVFAGDTLLLINLMRCSDALECQIHFLVEGVTMTREKEN